MPIGNALYKFGRVDHVAVVSAEEQRAVTLPLDSVLVLDQRERRVFRTSGQAAWFDPTLVRDELRRIRERTTEPSAVAAVEETMALVDYSCETGTGVGIVPPPGTV